MTDKPKTVSRFAGKRADLTPRSCRVLALSLRDYATAAGLTPRGMEHSRCNGSHSLYLNFDDARGRRWIMRVASHLAPRQTGHELPHVELVSFDGASGLETGQRLIDAILGGDIPWFDPATTVRRLRPRRMMKGARKPK